MLVEVKHLSKFFGTKLVFRNLGFSAGRGEIVLVLGSNGSGKSTLLRILAGLLHPSSGSASVSTGPGEIGYMGHQTCVYPGWSAWENISFWSKLYRRSWDKEGMEEILKRLGLHRTRHELVTSFSRGMTQRLNLARVLTIDPWLYLLDEPSTGLDMASQEVLHEKMLELRDKGRTLVWVSHQPEADRAYADKVLHLQGKSGWMETTA